MMKNLIDRLHSAFLLQKQNKKTRLKLNLKLSIQASGTSIITRDMARVHKFGQMAQHTKVIGKMTKQMDKVNYNMEMVKHIRDFG